MSLTFLLEVRDEAVREVEIAVDTGGTFTDCVVRDCASGQITGFKVLSTPHDPSVAIFNALQVLLDRGEATAAEIGAVLHATTVATNALIERKGSKVGLITTEGFLYARFPAGILGIG